MVSEPKGPATGALKILSGHTLIYLLGSLAAKVAAFLLLPIFTPLFTPDEFGILALTDATISLLLQFVGLKLDTAMTRHYFESDDEEGRKLVVSTAFLAMAALSLLAAALVYFSADWLALVMPSEKPEILKGALRWVALILAAMLMTEMPLAVLKAQRRSIAAVSWQLGRLALEVTAKIVLVVSFGLGVFGVLSGQAFAAVIFLLGFTVWLIRRHGLRFDPTLLRSMVAYSAPMILAGICGFLLHSVDRFMMPSLVSMHALGLYDVGYKFGSAMTALVLGPFLFIWYPFIFSLKDEEKRREVISNAALHTPTVLVAMSLPVALLAPEIIRLLTDPKFHGAWIYIPIVLFSYLFWGLFQIIQMPFYVHKRTGDLPRVVGAAALLNIVLNFALMPLMGAMGAALATLAALVFLAAVGRRAANRLELIPIDWGRIGKLGLVCAVAAGAIHLVPLEAALSLPLRLATLILGLAYLAGPFLTRRERAQLRELLSAIRSGRRPFGN
ncbi:MAG: oligosaccharide flippase family protein [Planctomycetota bacterium]